MIKYQWREALMFYTKCYRIKFFFRSCDNKICYRNQDGQHLQRCLHKQQKMIIIHRVCTNSLISTDRIRTDGWYWFKPRNLTTCTTAMPCHLYWPDPSAVDLRYMCVTCWQDLDLSQEVASHHWKNWQWAIRKKLRISSALTWSAQWCLLLLSSL